MVAVAGLVSLTACKKDYVCECKNTTTQKDNSGTDTETSSSKTEYKDVTKRWVNNTGACTSGETVITQTSGGETLTYTYISDCKLVK